MYPAATLQMNCLTAWKLTKTGGPRISISQSLAGIRLCVHMLGAPRFELDWVLTCDTRSTR